MSGFVGFLEKIKNERRTLWPSVLWPDLALGGFRIVSKKWTDQCEDCSLKKKVTARDRQLLIAIKLALKKLENN